MANLDWRNGHEFALQTAQILKQRDLDFVYRIVGQGPFLDAVAYARHELGLEEQVDLILKAPLKEMESIFAWANVFLLAAVSPGAGHALEEALRRSLLIICTDVPGIIDIVAAYPKLCIFPRRDPLAIADYMFKNFSKLSSTQLSELR